MNHTTNDRGETVIAVGAPGSVARIRVEHPVLLERIARAKTWCEVLIQIGVADCMKRLSRLEVDSILEAAELLPTG